MSGIDIRFELADFDDEQQFLRRYLVPAWRRFEGMDAFETGWFWCIGHYRFGETGTFDTRTVTLVLDADPDAIIECERNRWDELAEQGRIESWSTQTYEPEFENLLAQQKDSYGEVGGELMYRLKPITARMSLDLLEEFDERLSVEGTTTEKNPSSIGIWATIHLLMAHNGYDWNDEVDACTKAITNRTKSLAFYENKEDAQDLLREAISELETFSEEFAESDAE